MTARIIRTALVMTLVSACNKDKECTPPTLSEQIVGTWNASLVSEHLKTQEVTFKSDGKFVEANGLLFGKILKSEDKWKVKSDSLFVEAKFANGTESKYEFSLISRTCDEIIFDLDGADQLKLTKNN